MVYVDCAGSIPAELGNMSDIRSLQLYSNSLTGKALSFSIDI